MSKDRMAEVMLEALRMMLLNDVVQDLGPRVKKEFPEFESLSPLENPHLIPKGVAVVKKAFKELLDNAKETRIKEMSSETTLGDARVRDLIEAAAETIDVVDALKVFIKTSMGDFSEFESLRDDIMEVAVEIGFMGDKEPTFDTYKEDMEDMQKVLNIRDDIQKLESEGKILKGEGPLIVKQGGA
jgi:hypothetical protein